jgi:hypothetical protein
METPGYQINQRQERLMETPCKKINQRQERPMETLGKQINQRQGNLWKLLVNKSFQDKKD